jgi:hypothetical protein
MPFGYEYQCDHCGLEIKPSGLWEFYCDELFNSCSVTFMPAISLASLRYMI